MVENNQGKVLKRLYLQMEAMLATLLSSRPTKQRGNEVQKNHLWWFFQVQGCSKMIEPSKVIHDRNLKHEIYKYDLL